MIHPMILWFLLSLNSSVGIDMKELFKLILLDRVYFVWTNRQVLTNNFSNCTASILIGCIKSSKLAVLDSLFENYELQNACISTDIHRYTEFHHYAIINIKIKQ